MPPVSVSTTEEFPQQKDNAVMRKFARAHINSLSNLKYYMIHETPNPCLVNSGDSGFQPTTQKGFLALIDGNQDFW